MTPHPLSAARGPVPGAEVRAALRRAARMLAVAPFVASTLTGCYSYARVGPGASAPAPGEFVAAEITDQGRVALADSLGPSPSRVEGRLVSASDTAVTLAVTAVRSLGGDRATWAGERVTLRRTSVSQLTQRRLSVGRSVVAGAIAVGAVVALAIALGITGFSDGGGGDRTNPLPPGEQ